MSSLENTTQQTAQPESTPTLNDASQNVTNETAGITNVTRQITFTISKFKTDNKKALTTYISEDTTITTILTSLATNLKDTSLITTVSKERVSEASIVCGK